MIENKEQATTAIAIALKGIGCHTAGMGEVVVENLAAANIFLARGPRLISSLDLSSMEVCDREYLVCGSESYDGPDQAMPSDDDPYNDPWRAEGGKRDVSNDLGFVPKYYYEMPPHPHDLEDMGYTTPVKIEEIRERISEVERLRGLLWYAYSELNAIRARSGVPLDRDGTKLAISEEWWDALVEEIGDTIAGDDVTPWPTDSAKKVYEAFIKKRMESNE